MRISRFSLRQRWTGISQRILPSNSKARSLEIIELFCHTLVSGRLNLLLSLIERGIVISLLKRTSNQLRFGIWEKTQSGRVLSSKPLKVRTVILWWYRKYSLEYNSSKLVTLTVQKWVLRFSFFRPSWWDMATQLVQTELLTTWGHSFSFILEDNKQ